MFITVSFYTESTLVVLNESSKNSYDSFRTTILDCCSFIKDTSNIKFYFINESSRVFVENNTSLKQFVNSGVQTLYAINEQFENNIIENSPEDVNQFIQEIDSIEHSKTEEIRNLNQNLENEIRIVSQNLTEIMKGLLSEHVTTQISSLIQITPNNPSDETNMHLLSKQCAICGVNPLTGHIYECEACSNYMVCHQCFERFKSQHCGHNKEHNFYKVVYDNALYKAGKAEERKTAHDYIQGELAKIKTQSKDFKIQPVNTSHKIYWNYMEKEAKRKEKIQIEFENIGNKNISGNILTSPFGSVQYNVYKTDTDVPVDVKKGDKVVAEFTPPSVLEKKQVGPY